MFRFLVALSALCAAAYFAWPWFSQPPAGPKVAPGGLFRSADGVAPTSGTAGAATQVSGGDTAGGAAGLVKAAGPAVDGAARGAEGTVPLQAKGGSDPLVRGILAADAAALKIGFREMVTAEEPQRGRILSALRRAAAAAGDLDARLRLLGSGNAFLHSEDGRALLRRTLVDIRRLDREAALAKSNALLEKCMRGPIAKGDEAAYAAVNEVYADHRRLVDQVVFNPTRMTKARSYKVQSGDTLDGIARLFRKQGIQVDGWTLCIVNRIGQPNRLQADKVIKIPVEPISAKLEKESFLFAVYIGETIVRLYWVGHGKDGSDTPETTFSVSEKLTNPDWDAPDGNRYPFGHPQNVLGSYFVKFAHESLQGFGAHGTTQPETIRTRSSLGCIRMLAPDIEEFARFFPRHCKVVVTASR